jgi:hypothetical protein
VPRGTDVNEGPAFKSPIRDRRILHLPWVACQEVLPAAHQPRTLRKRFLRFARTLASGSFSKKLH